MPRYRRRHEPEPDPIFRAMRVVALVLLIGGFTGFLLAELNVHDTIKSLMGL